LSEQAGNDSRDLVAQLQERISGLTDLVERLQAKMTRLETRAPQPAIAGAGAAVESAEPLDRRRMLKGAGLAAAAGTAALVVAGKASPAGAITNPLNLDVINNGSSFTQLNYVGGGGAVPLIFLVNDTAFASNETVHAATIAGWAGQNSGETTNTGVYGFSEAPSGNGVVGRANVSNSIGVRGESNGGMAAIVGAATESSRALIATTIGTGQSIWSHIDNASNTKDSIRSETTGSGSGIYASSAKGVGGKFAGKTANVQLVPSTSSNHPASGSPGQLFVDSFTRLWFCHSGTNWTQLA